MVIYKLRNDEDIRNCEVEVLPMSHKSEAFWYKSQKTISKVVSMITSILILTSSKSLHMSNLYKRDTDDSGISKVMKHFQYCIYEWQFYG